MQRMVGGDTCDCRIGYLFPASLTSDGRAVQMLAYGSKKSVWPHLTIIQEHDVSTGPIEWEQGG